MDDKIVSSDHRKILFEMNSIHFGRYYFNKHIINDTFVMFVLIKVLLIGMVTKLPPYIVFCNKCVFAAMNDDFE